MALIMKYHILKLSLATLVFFIAVVRDDDHLLLKTLCDVEKTNIKLKLKIATMLEMDDQTLIIEVGMESLITPRKLFARTSISWTQYFKIILPVPSE